MPDMKFIQVAILVWGGAFCLIAALCMFLSSNYNREKRRYLILMEGSTAILLLMDATAYIFRGYPGSVGSVMVHASNFLVFFMSEIVLICFHTYVGIYLLTEKERRTVRRVKAGYIIACAGAVLVIISQFTNLYYYIDADNYYHRMPMYILSFMLPVVCMIIDLTLLIQYRKKVSTMMLVSMLSYILLPVIAATIQTFWYGLSLINFSIGISMIFMFVVAMVEMNQEMYTLMRREGKMKERLEIATVLNRCVGELLSEKEDDTAIRNLLGIISEYFNGDRSYIVEINEEKQVFVNTYEYAVNGITEEKDNLQEIPLDMLDVWMDSFRKNGLYYIADLETEKGQPYYETLKMQDITRLLTVPLNSEGKIIGFLGVDNPRLHYEDHTLLSSLQYFLTDSLKAKKQKEQLRYMSYRDMLTTLYNRNKYIQVVENSQAEVLSKVGVAYIDINGLKQTNDSYGHEAGDQLIINTGRSIIEVLPENAYRVGGDEFVIICFNIEEAIFRKKIQTICENIAEKAVSVSVGRVWEEAPDDLEAMLKRADDLMYTEKKRYYEMNIAK